MRKECFPVDIKKKINSNFTSGTSIYCLLGDPVRHSLSPVMHNAAFEYFNYNGIYLAFSICDIKSAIIGVRGLNILGCSITIPHKISVMKYLDYIDKTAIEIGAVNTIVNKKGSLIGYNFDLDGAMAALLEITNLEGRTVVMLGAGGAARAIGYGIKKNKGHLKIINRTKNRGKDLAFELNADLCKIDDLYTIEPDIIVNATSVGMSPQTEIMPLPREILNSSMIVMDIVYDPVETMLLKTAREVGCKTIDGLTMLAYQGALQFESWTKLRPSLKFVKKILLEYAR